ncbi:hypothetical protein PTI98_007487 [Pleurotus ostreatus]|nr:hypothetical protein PTI98_007487 [Pleurotus ostreatus]
MAPSDFKQAPHKILAIPGPIEVTNEVLEANARPPVGHTSPEFIQVFGSSICMTREILYTKYGQVFLIAGSGTLGWDQVSANLVEPGESVLVLHSGYFGDSFRECLETYGAHVDELRADIGASVDLAALAAALRRKTYKAVTFTHVDTSTGVLSDARGIAATVRSISPETLVILDGVCSVASEEIRMDDWDIDVIMTASQKGLGAPPGLSILVASPKAMKVFETRKTPPTSYYASWKKWLPVMRAYETGTPAYFATPPVNLIYAYHASLRQITRSSPAFEERIRIHRQVSARVKAIASQLGLKQVPSDSAHAANGMTAVYYPEGMGASDILPRLAEKGVVVAGGLHKNIKDKYFRIGHMGASAVDPQRGDIDAIARSLKASVEEARAAKGITGSFSAVETGAPRSLASSSDRS